MYALNDYKAACMKKQLIVHKMLPITTAHQPLCFGRTTSEYRR